MAKQNCKSYEFHCESCNHEFKSTMWATDENYDGNWVPEGSKCPNCEALCFPENFSPPKTDNSVTDKDVRTGNWVHKLPGDWKDLNNKIATKYKSSITTMEKI